MAPRRAETWWPAESTDEWSYWSISPRRRDQPEQPNFKYHSAVFFVFVFPPQYFGIMIQRELNLILHWLYFQTQCGLSWEPSNTVRRLNQGYLFVLWESVWHYIDVILRPNKCVGLHVILELLCVPTGFILASATGRDHAHVCLILSENRVDNLISDSC